MDNLVIEGKEISTTVIDNLVIEGKEICTIFECLINSDQFEIVKAILHCKYCLKHDKNQINNAYDNIYERCEKYLEESKKYVSPEYINKYLK